MTTTYIVSNTTSDLTGGLDFNKALVQVGVTTGTASIALATSATRTSYAFTLADEPGTLGITGNYTIRVRITTGSNNGRLACSVSRVNSAGVAQATGTATAEQTTGAGTLTFTISAANLGTWGSGDRLRVNYIYRNNSTMTAITLAQGFGTATDDVVCPWGELIALTGESEASASSLAQLGVAANIFLEGDAQAQASTSAAAVVLRALVGEVTTDTQASADLIADKTLEATAVASGASVAELALEKTFGGSVTTASAAFASLKADKAVAAEAAAQGAAQAELSITCVLQAQATAEADTASALSLDKPLVSAAAVFASATASASADKVLVASAEVFLATAAETSVNKSLAAAAQTQAQANATLGVAKPVAGSTAASATSSGAVDISVFLVGSVTSFAQAPPVSLGVSKSLDGAAATSVAIGASLQVTITPIYAGTINGYLYAGAAYNNSLRSYIDLDGESSAHLSAVAAIEKTSALASSILVVAASDAQLLINKPLQGQAAAVVQTQTTLALVKGLEGSADAAAQADAAASKTAALTGNLPASGFAVSQPLTLAKPLNAQATLTADTAAAPSKATNLFGTGNADALAQAGLSKTTTLFGDISAQAETGTPALQSVKELSGAIEAQAAAQAAVSVDRLLFGSITAGATSQSTVHIFKRLNGDCQVFISVEPTQLTRVLPQIFVRASVESVLASGASQLDVVVGSVSLLGPGPSFAVGNMYIKSTEIKDYGVYATAQSQEIFAKFKVIEVQALYKEATYAEAA